MSVFFNTAVFHGRKVIVDDVHDVLDVDAASSHTSGDEDGSLSGAECTKSCFTLGLAAIAMHGRHWETHVVEEVIEVVDFRAAVAEDDGADAMHLLEKADEDVTLLVALGLNHNLLDVLGGTSSTSDAEAHMGRCKMGHGELSRLTGEGGREQGIFDVAFILV